MRRTPLASRLRAHVVGEFDSAELGWWTPRSRARPLSGVTGWRLAWWRLTARRRSAELAEVIGQLATLVAIGSGLVAAIERIAERAQGPLADDLAVVAGWLREGHPADRALRRWADASASAGVGRLAAAVRTAAPGDDLAHRLTALATALRERAHDQQLVAARRVVRLAWVATGLAVGTSVTAVLP